MIVRQGAVVLPLVSSTANSLLQDADPALFHTLGFLRFLVAQHLGARLIAEAALCAAPITAAIGSAIPFDPAPYLTADQLKFPLFAVYRQSSESVQRSDLWLQNNGTLNVEYILPPLTAGQAERLLPILHACSAMMARAIQLGADALYTPVGGTLGESVWKFAGIEKADLSTESYGTWSDGGELVFHTWSAQLKISERTNYSRGFPGSIASQDYQPLADVEIHEDIRDNETATTVPDIVVIRKIP